MRRSEYKIQLNLVEHVPMFTVLFSIFHFFAIDVVVQISPRLMIFSGISAIVYGTDQNFLDSSRDSQMS